MKKKSAYTLLLLLAASLLAVRGEGLKPRIAGMERDSAYMALLEKEQLVSRELDSLEGITSRTRELFQENPEKRETLSSIILTLEGRVMALNSEKRALTRHLEALEQEWLLKHWEEPAAAPAAPAGEQPRNYEAEPEKRYLIDNACFRGELPAADYDRLREVQEQERDAAALIERFAENYARLLEMRQQHLLTTDQGEADSLYGQMDSLLTDNEQLNDQLTALWEPIFDHKSYAYAYLLDRLNCNHLLETQIERLNEAQRQADAEQGEYASDGLTTYFLEKRAMVRCEMELAAACQLFSARDSLQHEFDYLTSAEYRLPRITPERRHLLDYASVTFPKKVSYTAYKVPACRVYESGTIYRIRLMDSKYRQKIEIFRGVEPLYLLQEGGRYIYFTGGFATLAEARLARELLIQKGFRMPQIVRWTDGRREEVSDEESETTLHLEISGTDQLSEEIRTLIREAAPGGEISRIGSTFRIGGFSDPTVAEELARRIRRSDSSLEVVVHAQ